MTLPPGWPEGLGLRHYESLDSTNEEARRLAAAGEKPPLWIVARQQTAGHGRRGRAWISEPGNLFATLLIQSEPLNSAQLAFAAGLAVAETVEIFTPGARVTLKWPNDVLLEGKKVSGILLEGANAGTLAIGIGVNLAHSPLQTEFPAISLAAWMGRVVSPEDVLPLLAQRMSAWYEHWKQKGFEPVRKAWLERAEGLGRPIRARLMEGEKFGVFEGIGEDGALILCLPDGTHENILAGDVFF